MHKFLLAPVLLLLSMSINILSQAPAAERPVWVPDINGLATTLVKPSFPETAVDVGADGASVALKVVVDESGNPISATCSLTCHPMLKDAAELAAMTSKFKPQVKDGRPVKYEGTLLYTFVVRQVNWYRFGTAIESTRQFDNISLGPVAQILSSDFAAEKARLLSLDAGGVDYDTRQKVIAEVISALRSKLKGVDLWRFDVGMALRRVTFWGQVGGRIDRAELQKSIDELPGYIASVPEGVSDRVLKELTALSNYRVVTEMPERDLRRAVAELSRRIPPDLK